MSTFISLTCYVLFCSVLPTLPAFIVNTLPLENSLWINIKTTINMDTTRLYLPLATYYFRALYSSLWPVYMKPGLTGWIGENSENYPTTNNHHHRIDFSTDIRIRNELQYYNNSSSSRSRAIHLDSSSKTPSSLPCQTSLEASAIV